MMGRASPLLSLTVGRRFVGRPHSVDAASSRVKLSHFGDAHELDILENCLRSFDCLACCENMWVSSAFIARSLVPFSMPNGLIVRME